MNTETNDTRLHMLQEVLDGLRQKQKRLPSKYFYDERGSELFEQITHLPEYYPTRTEKSILTRQMESLAGLIGPDAVIIELGSGSSRKTRLLLDHLQQIAAYIPVDISDKYLLKVAHELREDYPEMLIKPVCADYTKPFSLPSIDVPYGRQLVFFPGSTIGNFEPQYARHLLSMIHDLLESDGAFLIGVDLKKTRSILERAYNDSKGVTAAFNKNMLLHLNRELGTDFDPDLFGHRACYNEAKGRIEMHLVSHAAHTAHLDGEKIEFSKGESIHTENSYKYSVDEFRQLVQDWFRVKHVWTDEQTLFSLQYLVKK